MLSNSLKVSVLFLLNFIPLNSGQTDNSASSDNNGWVRIPTASGGSMLMLRQAASLEASQQAVSEKKFNESHVTFVFHSRSSSSQTGEAFQLADFTAVPDGVESVFDSAKPTRILIHGWMNDRDSPFNVKLRDNYLAGWDFNVIVVDWSKCAKKLNYFAAASCVEVVGTAIGQMLNQLQANRGLNLDDVYLVGHSLGAHAAGVAGRTVGSGNISTIFGLDPALPLFSDDDKSNRVVDTDAQYVEVIHTNAGFLGFLDPIGRVDFYPNGGINQPGCFDASPCDHGRAWEYFADTLAEQDVFIVGRQVNSLKELSLMRNSAQGWAKMGGEPSNVVLRDCCVSGMYYIKTKDHSPFF